MDYHSESSTSFRCIDKNFGQCALDFPLMFGVRNLKGSWRRAYFSKVSTSCTMPSMRPSSCTSCLLTQMCSTAPLGSRWSNSRLRSWHSGTRLPKGMYRVLSRNYDLSKRKGFGPGLTLEAYITIQTIYLILFWLP